MVVNDGIKVFPSGLCCDKEGLSMMLKSLFQGTRGVKISEEMKKVRGKGRKTIHSI